MNLNEQNVPQAYKEFMAKNPNNQMLILENEDSGQEYTLYCYDHLIAHNPHEKTPNQVPNHQWLAHADLDFKPLEGDIDNISENLLRQAFVFGSIDGGKLFFHPQTHQVYVIYLDLYVRKIADNFDDFLNNTTVFDKWEI